MTTAEKKKEYNRTAYLKRKQQQNEDMDKYNKTLKEYGVALYPQTIEYLENQIPNPYQTRDKDRTYEEYLRLNETIIKSYENELEKYDKNLMFNIINIIKNKIKYYKDYNDYDKRRKIITGMLMELKHNGNLINPNMDDIKKYLNYMY